MKSVLFYLKSLFAPRKNPNLLPIYAKQESHKIKF
jgi:hypothetical protein